MRDSSNQKPPSPDVPSPFDNAELYDVLFADLDFDRSFYLELARAAHGAVLEVACGSGRILIPCLQAGVKIEGIDNSRPMLTALLRKAAGLGLQATVHHADMRDFVLANRYDLVFIAFNGFVHALTTAEQLETLQRCRHHLNTGGMLVFNVFYPGLEIIAGTEGVPVLEHEALHPATGLPVRIYDTRTLNRVEQIQYSSIEIQELDAEGRVMASHRSETSMRWTFKPEMELLLRASGFSRWQICGGFNRRPLEREDDLMVVFAWKDLE
ncbi:MAG TPA: class I SAM-dependent methyltransferase [Acidobacteriota bacterium]|nr:class I SAM-dependent methyltransferase [Acidobacteriota bacterium]